MTKVFSVIISRVFYTKIAVVARARPLPTIWAHRDKRRPLPRLQRQEDGWDLRGHRLHGLYDEESVWGWINKSSVWRWNQIVDKTVFSRRYTPCDRLRTPSETTSSSSWDWTYRHHGKISFLSFPACHVKKFQTLFGALGSGVSGLHQQSERYVLRSRKVNCW